MYEMTMNSGAVVSVSAVTKAQVTNAEILFGKNAKVLIKRIDELVKIKELDTSKLEAVLDILRDTEATTAFAKKAAGKNAVTAIKNLYKAKTLVATVNGLRAIKIKVTAPNAAAKVDVKPQPVAKTKGDTGIKPAKVTATRVNQNAELPKVDLARITPAFMKTISQAQTDAIADQLSKATGLKFLPIYQETNGQSSPWVFEAHNPKAGYRSVSIDPPYAFHSQMRSIKWAVSAVDSKGGIYVGNELKSPTAAALANAVKDVIGKPSAKEVRTGKTDVANSVDYDKLYGALMTGGDGENVKELFKTMGIPKPASVEGTVANMGGDEDCIFLVNRRKKKGVVFGVTSLMIDQVKHIRGRGKFTVATFNPGAGSVGDLPKTAFKQLGVFSTNAQAYAAFVEYVKSM